MSLGLIKPGLRSDLRHPLTGEPVKPLYTRADGSVVWPVMGGAPEDGEEDDPEFTGEDEDDEDDDDEPKSKKRPVKKKTKVDDEDEDDEDDDKPTRPERQAARYRVERNKLRAERDELSARLKALEDKDKPAEEVTKREAAEAKEKADKLAAKLRDQTLQLAFFRASDIDWVNPAHALKLVDLDEVDVDDDGTVDERQLKRALRALAKEAPHLVKPTKSKDEDDEDDDDDEDEPRSTRSARPATPRRKGSTDTSNRAALEKKFPVLRGR